MKKLMIMLLALLSVSLAATAQQLSGKVTDANGGLEGVTVAEVDKNDRVLNQTKTDGNGIFQLPLRSNRNRVRVFKDGYGSITERIDGRATMRITLASKAVLDIDRLQTVRKPKSEDTKALLEGHAANGQATDQWVRLEQLTDTSYIFAIALAVKPQQETYPAGRGLLFLDLQDRRILRLKCLVDCYPTISSSEFPDLESIIHGDNGLPTTSGDLQFKVNQRNGANQIYWLVPSFEISDKGLETLYAKGRDVFRLAIEMPGAEGFWFVYPKEGWVDQLRTLISRIRPNR
jgi:hypothetical protein